MLGQLCATYLVVTAQILFVPFIPIDPVARAGDD